MNILAHMNATFCLSQVGLAEEESLSYPMMLTYAANINTVTATPNRKNN